jgi:hypothetical protein
MMKAILYATLVFCFWSSWLTGRTSAHDVIDPAAKPFPNVPAILPPKERKALIKEFGTFSSCVANRPIVMDAQGGPGAITVIVTKNASTSEIDSSCAAHGTACYDSKRDIIFMDTSVLHTPFISRQVGTQYEASTDFDNRVRLYRQFAFLHELGHKDRHHGGRSSNTDRKTLESEADNFAIDCFIQAFNDNKLWDKFTKEVQEPNQERSRVKLPKAQSPSDRAAIAIAEMASEANIALLYGDHVSPYQESDEYLSFVKRAQNLIYEVKKRIKNRDVETFIDVGLESLRRVEATSSRLIAIISKPTENTIASLLFDEIGLNILLDDYSMFRLSYEQLEKFAANRPTFPKLASFPTICVDRKNAIPTNIRSLKLVKLGAGIYMWGKGNGVYSCHREGKYWEASKSFSDRGAQDWDEITSNWDAPNVFYATKGDYSNGTIEIHSSTNLVAKSTISELNSGLASAVNKQHCQGFPHYDQGTVTFRCDGSYAGFCILGIHDLGIRSCQLVEDGVWSKSADQQAIFYLEKSKGQELVAVSSNLDPFRVTNEPRAIRFDTLSLGAEIINSKAADITPLVENKLPPGDLSAWMTVVHPPLIFCRATPLPGILCVSDRESAYSFDPATGKTEIVFHPARNVPIPGHGFMAVTTKNRSYVYSLNARLE